MIGAAREAVREATRFPLTVLATVVEVRDTEAAGTYRRTT